MNTPRPPATPRYSNEQAALANRQSVREGMAKDIINLLFEHTFDDLHDELIDIVQENVALVGSTHKSFLYKGIYYNIEPTEATTLHDLHASLVPRMEDYLAERKQIFGYEVPVIKGILQSLFIASDRISDYKQVLPEQVHGAFRFYCDPDPVTRTMLPAEIVRFQKRVAPFISIMKARMLQNLIQGQTP